MNKNFFTYFFSIKKIHMPTKKHLNENNHNYENVTTELFCYQNDLHINTTEQWLKENRH